MRESDDHAICRGGGEGAEGSGNPPAPIRSSDGVPPFPHLSTPTWYTGPTCDLKLAMNVPLTPSHSLTDLSNDADRIHRPSGENWT